MKRIEKQIDVEELIRTQMRVKVALKALMTPVERYLLRNNRSFVLDSASSGSDTAEIIDAADAKKHFIDASLTGSRDR